MGRQVRPTGRWSRRRVLSGLLIGAGAVAGLLGAAQVVLPRIAAAVVRDRLGGGDQVVSVSVRAVPAIQLLWRHADRVTAHVRSYDADGDEIADELAETATVGELDVRIDRLRVPRGLVLRDVRLRKRKAELHGEALVDPADLAGALPRGLDVRPVASDDGGVVLEGRARAFGVGASLRLRVAASGGRVVVAPEVPLLGALAAITLFADPRIDVERIAARQRPDGRFELRAWARVLD
jgi:hypothetical protein